MRDAAGRGQSDMAVKGVALTYPEQQAQLITKELNSHSGAHKRQGKDQRPLTSISRNCITLITLGFEYDP